MKMQKTLNGKTTAIDIGVCLNSNHPLSHAAPLDGAFAPYFTQKKPQSFTLRLIKPL